VDSSPIINDETYDDIFGKPKQISKHVNKYNVNKYNLQAKHQLDYKRIHKGNTTNVVLSPLYIKNQIVNGIYHVTVWHDNPLLLSDTISDHKNLSEEHDTPTDVYQALLITC
jgi:hypothetical protein